MPIRLIINHDKGPHRFIQNLQLQVTGEGVQEAPKGSVVGRRSFNVPDTVGAQFEIRVTIPEPEGPPGSMLLDVRQPLKIVAGVGGPSLAAGNTTRWGNNLHPRLEFRPKTVRSGAGRVFELGVDTTFLNVTSRARRLGRLRAYDALKPTLPATGPHYGVKLFLLEFTRGRPVTWAVLIPPALHKRQERKEIGALIFFRPKGNAYVDTDDEKMNAYLAGRLNRFLADPPLQSPFYAQTQSDSWDSVPNCGWENQLNDADRPLIFVHPLPHEADFGVSFGPRMVALLRSIVRALWADDAIGAKVSEGVELERLGVAGFSFGGGVALHAFASNLKSIDELYLFDPNPSIGTSLRLINGWFRTGGKKLRMVAGFADNHQAMLALARQLNSVDATVQPKTLDFWQQDSLYRKAVGLRQFSASNDPRPNLFSQNSGMFLVGSGRGNTSITLQGRFPDGQETRPREVLNCSSNEAASMVLVNTRNPRPKPGQPDDRTIMPIRSERDFLHNLAVINKFVKFIRHQWTVLGGFDTSGQDGRDSSFVGYLLDCLSRSDF